MPNPQIDMETPKIKSVEEVASEINESSNAFEGLYSVAVEIITQDRSSIHTSLVAAVEGKKRPTVCHTLHCLKGKAENHDMCVMNVPAVDLAYNQALEDTLTTINSIFKE